MDEFFLVALPGLEDLVLAELKDWYPEADAKAEHGGVSVRLPAAQGFALNLCLKTPTRILLRISHFRVKDFPKLFQKVSAIAWETWVAKGTGVDVHASTRVSRLKIKTRIEQTCQEAWDKHFRLKGEPKHKVDLYVRLVNDECTLSLDTSGERLHKRGARTHVGDAPLRETIAAALIQLVGRAHDSQPGVPVEVVDPMMGSGTFLLEAATRDQLVDARAFAFECFNLGGDERPELKVSRPIVAGLTGFERDASTLKAARTNLSACKDVNLNLLGQDIFAAEPLPSSATRRWVFVNPPYGERLRVDEPLMPYYEKLFAAVELVVSPERVCALLPSKPLKGKFQLPLGWKVLEKRPFLNGGIPVTAFVFGRIKG